VIINIQFVQEARSSFSTIWLMNPFDFSHLSKRALTDLFLYTTPRHVNILNYRNM